VAQRIFIAQLQTGQTDLTAQPARYLRDVLRLGIGDLLEAFDASGSAASAKILAVTSGSVTLEIGPIKTAPPAAHEFTIAAAIPKGARADWMIEKITELGAAAFIPLIAARSVSLPKGEKPQRWVRLAAEAARQSGRAGMPRIEPLTAVTDLLNHRDPTQLAWFFSTEPGAIPIARLTAASPPRSLLMLIGPEGGWNPDEIGRFRAAGLTGVKLTPTTLRVETAALAAASAAALWFAGATAE